MVTANNQVAPDDYPHHITSDYLDGYRARRIEQLIDAERRARPGELRGDADGHALASRTGDRARLARLRPRDQRELAAIERLRSWDGRMSPESVAATIYQAFTLRLAREVSRAAIGDRDLAERWLDRADNGFIAHVTSPWRWQSHLLALWEEGGREAGGPALGRAGAGRAARGPRRPRRRLGPDQKAWRWGKVHPLVFPHALGEANPLLGVDLQPPARGRRRPGDGRAGWLGPKRSVHRDLGPLLADRRRPGSAPSVRAGRRSPASPAIPASPHYDDLQADWVDGANPADGRRGPMAGARRWSQAPRPGLDEPPGPDQADRRGAARADRGRARRRRVVHRAARLAAFDAALVRAPRRARSGSTRMRSRRRSRTSSATRAPR